MPVSDLGCEPLPIVEGRVALAVRFTLPKGGYATIVLGRVARLRDASIARLDREQTPDAERLAQAHPSPQEEDDGQD